MVGLGGLDDLREAKRFVADFGITFTMLFDSSLRSWEALRIVSQPAAVLLRPDGAEAKRWLAEFPDGEIARAVDAAHGG